MKRKRLIAYLSAIVLLLGFSITAFAEDSTLTQPTNVKASVASGVVTLSWEVSTGATNYTIYRSTNEKKGYKKIKTVALTTYNDSKVDIGKTYYYKIYAMQNNNKSNASQVVKAVITPDAVKNLKVTTNDSGNAVLKWSKVAKADSYQIERSTSENSGYQKVGTTSKNKYTDSNLGAGTTYYYRVYSIKNKIKSSASKISYTAAKKIKLSKTSASLNKGSTVQLTGTISPSVATDKTITWSTSDKSVAKVSKSGTVTAIGSGTATITAKTINGKTATCKIKVKIAQASEMKAVWISYLDMQNTLKDTNEVEFKKQVSNMMKAVKNQGLNTVIVQVRAFSDAIYPSKYYPWASYITSSGSSPGYDPLKIMIDTAHDNGLSFHAWINPYRTASGSVADPASDSVRNRIVNGVAEIVEGYNVDGIHFDDYFYSSTDTTSQSEKMSNVNTLIRNVYSKINAIEPSVVFGISPSGNIDYAKSIGCDIDTWLSNSGYIDYICPQIYWSDTYLLGGATVQMYSNRLSQWVAANKNKTKMYVGLALYKAGTSSATTWGTDAGWAQSTNNLASQYKKAISSGCSGYSVFRYEYMFTENGKIEMSNLKVASQ